MMREGSPKELTVRRRPDGSQTMVINPNKFHNNALQNIIRDRSNGFNALRVYLQNGEVTEELPLYNNSGAILSPEEQLKQIRRAGQVVLLRLPPIDTFSLSIKLDANAWNKILGYQFIALNRTLKFIDKQEKTPYLLSSLPQGETLLAQLTRAQLTERMSDEKTEKIIFEKHDSLPDNANDNN